MKQVLRKTSPSKTIFCAKSWRVKDNTKRRFLHENHVRKPQKIQTNDIQIHIGKYGCEIQPHLALINKQSATIHTVLQT